MPVVDASVVVDWVAPDVDPGGPAGRLLRTLVREGAWVAAPPLMAEEVANALITGVRRGRWDGAAADRAFGQLVSMPLRLEHEPQDLVRAWDLSRRYDEHPVYDMVYLAVAERLGEELLTADARLVARVRLPWVVAVE